MSADDDAATIRAALERLPAECHYHGTGLDRPGPFGPACCGTGTTALARREALAALDRLTSGWQYGGEFGINRGATP